MASIGIKHIEHVEDLMFEDGSIGALKSVDIIEHAVLNSSDIQVKYDGSPSLIFGRNVDGEFVMTDKSGFYATRYDGRLTSKEAMRDMFLSRGNGRENLANRLYQLWDYLEGLVPADFIGYIWGDLLWVGQPPLINGKYTVKPNTITYQIPKSTKSGICAQRSVAGIVLHHRLESHDSVPQPIHQSLNLNASLNVCLFYTNIDDMEVSISENSIDVLRAYIGKYSTQINDSIIYTDSNIHKNLKKFINQCVRSGSYNDMTNRFSDYMSVFGLTDVILGNKNSFDIMFKVFMGITNLKLQLVSQLNEIKTDIDPLGGQEGFVVYFNNMPYKLVNRMNFSRRNFNKNDGGFAENA